MTTPDLTAILAEHRPVVGRFANLNAVVGCSCMDRVFIAHRENYQDHLAEQITAAGFGPVRAVEAEVARLREDIEALADAFAGITGDNAVAVQTWHDAAEALAALLAPTPDREEARDE